MNNLNYGVIGNCRTAALISQNGNIEWLCFPDFDSPSIFASMLDREKGAVGFDILWSDIKDHLSLRIVRGRMIVDLETRFPFYPMYVAV